MKFICHIFRDGIMCVCRHFQQYFSYIGAIMMKETGVPDKNHQPVACNWKTLSNNVVPLERASGWEEFELTMLVVICTDCICSCKVNTTTKRSRHDGPCTSFKNMYNNKLFGKLFGKFFCPVSKQVEINLTFSENSCI